MTAGPADVTFDSILRRSEDVLFQEVGGEAVLLDLASEQYFSLNGVGSRVWALLADALTIGEVHAHLCVEFDAPAEVIAHDLLTLAGQLAGSGLVKVTK